jgi:diguanylate cyclase (GGDEF)-like protein/PAS domain S-box-containing protein
MLGESGHAEGRDSRGVLVLASYRPVGDSGISLVAKMDSDEIYEPLISRGTWLLMLPIVVLIASAYLIKKILSPVADRLQASEQSAREHALKVSETLTSLELQQALLRSLTDAMPTLVSYIDRNETYQYCNEHYLHMFGIRFEDIIGKTVREFFGEEGYASTKPYLERAFKGETTWFERMVVARGEKRVLEGRYVPQLDSTGQVTGIYVAAWDATEARKRERHLSDQASKDSLTGLMNRPALQAAIEAEVDEHYKRRDGLALLFLDIDKFKQVNDTYGHAVGDELLIAFANRVKGAVRETDYIARFGGDEFVVLLTMLDSAAAAELVAKKIIQAVTQPIKLSGIDYRISTSIGAAYIHNQHLPAAQLLAKADELLYSAKQAGRDTYRLIDLSSA